MKIHTEIVQNICIVTCDGGRFDAPFAPHFLSSIQSLIREGHMDIILDLSKVEFVDSTGLGAIVRSLKEIGGRGQIILCGVNTVIRSLFKMTRLDDVFIQVEDRDEALKRMQVEQNTRNVAAQKPEAAAAPSKAAGFDDDLLASLTMEDGETVQEVDNGEKRRYRRIANKQIVSEDLIFNCTNMRTGKRVSTIVLDISPSGLLLVPPSELSAKDEFMIEGYIGKTFKLRERAVIRNCRGRKYGLEFVKPSEETTSFLHQLTGAVML